MLMKSEQSALQASGGISPMSSSSGGGTVYLGAASAKGDVFVSPSSTLFIEHGHTGIYYSKTVVVEAPGGNVKSRSIAASALRVGKGAVKQSVTVSTAKRDASANYAYNKLRSKAYNSNFAVNRDAYGRDMNCSQLVWAAFKIGASIDIDSDGGFGVYPYNIKDSKYTTT